MAGETSNFGAGNADAWVLKLDSSGNIGSGCSIIAISNAAGAAAGFSEGTSTVSGTPTTAVATPTSASPLDSAATTTMQCSNP